MLQINTRSDASECSIYTAVRKLSKKRRYIYKITEQS